MKTFLLLLVAVGLLSAGPSHGQFGRAASLDFFYQKLDPYGDWREVGDYGYTWQPRNVGPNWSPYSEGRWLYSDVGWTWDSDEPYGWSVYHYGRWANVNSIGWIWVPGTEWGPGWVSWRQNDQYVGWAPLPPEARFRNNIGFSSWVDNYYGIGPGHYRFVENRNFGSRRLSSVFIDQSQNHTIINRTTNITNIRYENNSIRNDGPRYEQLSQLSAEPIRQYKLQRRQNFDRDPRNHSVDHFRSRRDDDSLSVFAPPMDERRPSSGPGRHAEKVADARINRGWDRSGTPAEIATLRSQMKGTVDAPKDLPPEPRFDRDTTDRPGTPRPISNADRPPGRDDSKRETKPSGTIPAEQKLPGPDSKTPGPGSPNPQRPDMKRPESKQPQARPEPPKREQPQAKAPPQKKPETSRPEMKKPAAREPEARKPESKQPQARPEPPKREQPKAKAPPQKKPETSRPDMKKPAAREPEARKPESKQPQARPEPSKREQPKAKAPPQKKPETSRPAPEARAPSTSKPQSNKNEDNKSDKKKSK